MEKQERKKQVGYVNRVEVEPDRDAVRVWVQVGPRITHQGIRFVMPARGVFSIPEKGDIVEVDSLNGERVARWPYSSPEPGLPENLGAGDLAIKLSEDTLLHFDKQEDGTYTLQMQASSASIENPDGEGFKVESDGTLKLYGTSVDIRDDGTTFQ
jgi:hypothetical protein